MKANETVPGIPGKCVSYKFSDYRKPGVFETICIVRDMLAGLDPNAEWDVMDVGRWSNQLDWSDEVGVYIHLRPVYVFDPTDATVTRLRAKGEVLAAAFGHAMHVPIEGSPPLGLWATWVPCDSTLLALQSRRDELVIVAHTKTVHLSD